MKMLIPLVLALLGVGGGVGAGLALRPDTAATTDAPTAEDHATPAPPAAHDGGGPDGSEYVKLNNQFVVPIVTRDDIEALVVMTLSLEIVPGESETVYLREPKLRDVFLQVLFDHANMGGFRGTFTDTGKLATLRRNLLEVARKTLGSSVSAVLITDLTRQDL